MTTLALEYYVTQPNLIRATGLVSVVLNLLAFYWLGHSLQSSGVTVPAEVIHLRLKPAAITPSNVSTYDGVLTHPVSDGLKEAIDKDLPMDAGVGMAPKVRQTPAGSVLRAQGTEMIQNPDAAGPLAQEDLPALDLSHASIQAAVQQALKQAAATSGTSLNGAVVFQADLAKKIAQAAEVPRRAGISEEEPNEGAWHGGSWSQRIA
ncbi:MAG: hypothetical protein RLZZ602_2109, partial [Pseudomonadota bacterium]